MSAPLLWQGGTPLILASTSATRRMLAESAGLFVETEAPGIDERVVEASVRDRGPAQIATRLAQEKALAVSRRRPHRLVVGADQTLACGGTLLHKPHDRTAAREQLTTLSGRTHMLHSAVAIAKDDAIVACFVGEAGLTMRPLTLETIERYLDLAGETALQSVGAYQLEGLGIHLFESVEGDHSTILGLPLLPLLAALRDLNCLAL
jgi:septum formation protein